jgi:hypothetical protein
MRGRKKDKETTRTLPDMSWWARKRAELPVAQLLFTLYTGIPVIPTDKSHLG